MFAVRVTLTRALLCLVAAGRGPRGEGDAATVTLVQSSHNGPVQV